MAGVWNNDDSSSTKDIKGFYVSSNPNVNSSCATRTVVRCHCHTEEVQPGKYIHKCEKTEETFKHCLGRPDEVVQSTKEYTEEYVTADRMVKGPFSFDSALNGSSYFPGLRSDIEAIERDIFGGINSFFEAAEEMKNELFCRNDSSSSNNKRDFHIERN